MDLDLHQALDWKENDGIPTRWQDICPIYRSITFLHFCGNFGSIQTFVTEPDTLLPICVISFFPKC